MYDLLLHWYMNNPEYRVYEPLKDEQISSLDINNENIYNNSINNDSSTLVDANSCNLTRSRSGSRKRTFSHQSYQKNSPPSTPTTTKHSSNNILSNNGIDIENSNDANYKKK